MLTTDFVINGSAEEFLTSIAKNIKNEIEIFFAELRKDGKYEMFKTLPPFAQRVTFFHETGYGSYPYMKYREAIRSWILLGDWNKISDDEWWHSLCVIKEDAGSRADEIAKFKSKQEHSYWRYHDSYGLDFMSQMRKSLIEGNPILADKNIPLGLRKDLFNAALKGNEEYQRHQKCFDSFIKKIVSSMISNYLYTDEEIDPYYREYTRITEKA